MASTMNFCRCCYSSETLEMLNIPESDVYKLICDARSLKDDNTPIMTCIRCYEFLKEVHQFRINCHEDLDFKNHVIKTMLMKAADEDSSQINIKTEVILDFDSSYKTNMSQDSKEQLFHCDHCNYCTRMKNNIIFHVMNHLNDIDKPFKCNECSFKTTTVTYLKYHIIRNHTDERPFSCDQCDYRAKVEEDLNIHIKSHLKDRDEPYECSKCSYKTAVMRSLQSHIIRKHNRNKPFYCDQCDYHAKMKADVIAHKKKHLNILDGKSFKCCRECPYKTLTTSSLKTHFLRKHCDEKRFRCDHCDYCGKLKSQLVAHMHRHFKGSNKTFHCTECSYKTMRTSHLKNHILYKHSDERPFQCDFCNYCGKTREDLKHHKMKHLDGENKPLKCNKCSYQTRYGSHLRDHFKRKHTDDKVFYCDHCDYRGKFKCDMVGHMGRHFHYLKKTYSCIDCSYTASTLSNLNRHIMHRHNDEKPFHCDMCDYCAKTERSLATHKMKHLATDDKPHKCDKCSFQTIYKSHLSRHCKRKHDEGRKERRKLLPPKIIHLESDDRPFKCIECSYQSSNKADVQRHISYKHSDAKPFSCDECDYRAKLKGDLTSHKRKHLKY